MHTISDLLLKEGQMCVCVWGGRGGVWKEKDQCSGGLGINASEHTLEPKAWGLWINILLNIYCFAMKESF